MDISDSLMDRLKAETQEHHLRLEGLPLFTAVMEGNLPLESYVGFLRNMAVVHSVLEYQLSISTNPVISRIWQKKMSKLPFIEKDLAYFENQGIRDIADAAKHALTLAQRIRLWSTPKSVELLGCLYVLEGSTLGGQILGARIAKQFNLGTSGWAYLLSYGKETKAQWQRFKRRMNTFNPSGRQRQSVVVTASEVFQGMARIVAALYPIERNGPDDAVSILNCEAGDHPVTKDPRELLAALDAGEVTWNTFPYFEWRYGDRGRRFTKSDSAWMVTLTDLSQELMREQVEWLAVVLASRGMPRLLLQRHLENLHEALVQAVPERRGRYDKLLRAADVLQTSRHKYIGEDRFQDLTDAFENMIGPLWSKRLAGTGAILVAAVADERAGIKRAVTSLEEWMMDSTRFPKKWIDAVKVTLQKARENA